MKLFANLQTFLYELYEDFSAHNKKGSEDIENCFYFGYLKRQKSEQASFIAQSRERLSEYAKRAKPNKFVLLHAAYLAFKFRKITADEYKTHFLAASENRDKAEKLFQGGIKTAADAEEINSALENRLLKNSVRDYFDNAGFKRLNDDIENYYEGVESVDNSLAESKYKKHSKSLEKNTDNIHMLYDYIYNYKHEEIIYKAKAPSDSAGLGEEFKYECAELFDTLNKSPNSSIFMPIYFDSQSGAGIFIIGKKQFDKSLHAKIHENCAVCIVRFSEIGTGVEPSGGYNAMDLIMWVEIHKDIRSAFEALEQGIRSNAFFSDYPDVNTVDEDAFDNPEILRKFEPRMSIRERIIADGKEKEKRDFELLKQAQALSADSSEAEKKRQ